MSEPVWQAVWLGILQGLTEFLPISSSAHLILLPWFLGWEPLGILFDVVIHGGTLLAILIYFRRDWVAVFQDSLRALLSRSNSEEAKPLGPAILIGTIPAVLAALLFRHPIELYARNPAVTVFTLAGFGLLLWWADRSGTRRRSLSDLTWRDGLIVGLAQSLALVPGVSRSGITITAALFCGLDRPDSARFSFLLAGPVIALAAAKGALDLILGEGDSGVPPGALAAGIATSFVTGFLCIKFFLRFLRSRTYFPFVIYRLCLAALILFLLVS